MIDALLNYRINLAASTNCSVSVSENTSINDLKLYPNPVVDFLQIQLNNVNINIIDTYGRILLHNFRVKDQMIDVSFLQPGTYFITINSKVYKFLKQ